MKLATLQLYNYYNSYFIITVIIQLLYFTGGTKHHFIATSALPTDSKNVEEAIYEDVEILDEPITTSTCVAYGFISNVS